MPPDMRVWISKGPCAILRNTGKWSQEHDRRLYRLVCYIDSTLHVCMTGWVGDDSKTSRSTSGLRLTLLGPPLVFPMEG